MYNSLQIKFLLFIAVVFLITVGFAYLINRQMKKVGKKAMEAKELQKEREEQSAAEQKPVQAEAEKTEEPAE